MFFHIEKLYRRRQKRLKVTGVLYWHSKCNAIYTSSKNTLPYGFFFNFAGWNAAIKCLQCANSRLKISSENTLHYTEI